MKTENEEKLSGNQGQPTMSYISQMHSEVPQITAEETVDKTTEGSSPEPTAPAAPIEPAESLEEILLEAKKTEIPATPAGYRINAQYRELKTQRTQLVFPPSLFRKVKRRAKKLNLSMNEFVCLILQAVVGNDPEN